MLLAGLFYVKKTEKEEEIFEGIAITAIIGMCFQVLVMGIFKLIHLPMNCYSIGLANLILGMILLLYSQRKRDRQKYIFIKKDAIANVVFLCLVAVWGLGRFGIGLDWFHYETVDMGKHVLEALEAAQNQAVRGMYFGQGQVGVWYQSLRWLSVPAYQIAIIFEIIVLYLVISGFWSIIRRYVTTWGSWTAALTLSCLYLFGYPACGEIFGSQYLVCGLMLVTALLIIFKKYTENIWDRKITIILLMLLANGLAVCYAQFCPVVFSTLGIGIIIKERKIKPIIITGFSVFLLPCISAVIFILVESLGSLGITGGLALEGYIYRDLYSDFLLILPFAVWKLLTDVKGKKITTETIFFLLSGLWIVIFFIGVLKGEIQGYYYYKNYYLLWISCWVMGSTAILLRWMEARLFISSFSIVWGSIAILHFTGADVYLADNYYVINQSTKSGMLFEIYDWNKEHYYSEGTISKERQELYREAGKLADDTQTTIPVLCPNGGFVFSYYAITEQLDYKQYIFESCGMETFWNSIQECQYLTVWNDQDYDEHAQYLGAWERVYENEAGYIARVQPLELVVELTGMYGPEGSGENVIRWGQKTGDITYTNYDSSDIAKEVSFEIIGASNIREDSSITIKIDGEEKEYYFEEGSIRCNLHLLIPYNESKSIAWTANVEPVSLEEGRELYIAFRNYDKTWDSE